MIRGATELLGYTVRATDGEAGVVNDIYFDDEYWTVRYIVVEVDGPTAADVRLVLVSPVALKSPRWRDGVLPLSISSDQLAKSPDAATEFPASRREEEKFSDLTGWPLFGSMGFPYRRRESTGSGDGEEQQGSATESEEDNHLRSCRELIGYRLQAKDGEMGHLRDVLISDTKWMVRYLLVDTRTWLTGKKVVVAPEWVDRIAWMESKVYLDLTKEDIKTSPDYISEGMLQRNMQAELARQVGSRQGR